MAFLVLGVVHSFFFGWVGSGWFSWEAAYGVRFLFRLFPVAGLFRGAGLRDRRRSSVTLHGRNPAGRMAGLFLVHGFAKRGGAPSSMGMVPGPLSGPWTRGRPASPPPHGLSRGPRIWSLPGPWTRQVVRGTVLSWSFSRGPCVWSAEWTVVCQGGPR